MDVEWNGALEKVHQAPGIAGLLVCSPHGPGEPCILELRDQASRIPVAIAVDTEDPVALVHPFPASCIRSPGDGTPGVQPLLFCVEATKKSVMSSAERA